MEVNEFLKKCVIDDNKMLVKLPDVQLDRKDYLQVAKQLENIGGKWNRKNKGFIFPHDPTPLLSRITGGEKINLEQDLKQKYQFFATPETIADILVEMSELNVEHSILEPTGGRGAIIEAINKKLPSKMIDTYELWDVNRHFLYEIKTANILGNDFLQNNKQKLYDRIIANPPFSKNRDIEFIREMFSILNPGGRLVSCASLHWLHTDKSKEREFKQWLKALNAQIYQIKEGVFKASGTNISVLIVIIDKPKVFRHPLLKELLID